MNFENLLGGGGGRESQVLLPPPVSGITQQQPPPAFPQHIYHEIMVKTRSFPQVFANIFIKQGVCYCKYLGIEYVKYRGEVRNKGITALNMYFTPVQ